MSLRQDILGFLGLGADINKVKELEQEQKEGVISDYLPELKLNVPDADLIAKTKKWRAKWTDYSSRELDKRQIENENYWRGKQYSDIEVGGRPLVDNLIFEALETYLPIVSRQNPEPFVQADDSQEGQKLAKTVQQMLVFQADRLRLRLKIKRSTRFWALYLLGVHKIAWSVTENDITDKVIRPQKLILDPDATIDEGGEYQGEYIGEMRQDEASELIKRFPTKKEFISKLVQDKLGTKVQYVEWWTDNALFWTLNEEVLDKVRNPHWNYENERKEVDEYGKEQIVKEQAYNHFPYPKKPYVFLTVFNLQKHPHDDTNLIEQNLPLQDLINKRYRQIDNNADNLNGGWAISLERAGLSQDQASQVIRAIRKGGAIAIPQGSVGEAIQHLVGTSLPADVFNSLADARQQLRGIFGVSGSIPEATREEKTVRGKILTKAQDADRSATIVDSIEQYADQIFNWYVQMMAVYYTEEHSQSIVGQERRSEVIKLKNDLFDRKLTVSVKEGSLIPKDSLTKRNEAIDLWGAQAIDPITLNERLEDPTPRETAEKLYRWKTAPQTLFPDIAQEVMDAQMVEKQQTAISEEVPQPSPDLLNQVPI